MNLDQIKLEDKISESERRLNILQRAVGLIRANIAAYIVINIIYYGLVILGMVYVVFNPGLQKQLIDLVGQGFTSGPLSYVGTAYGSGKLILAMGLTFVVNLLLGTVVEITLPSLIIPFSGFLMGTYRAILWGLLLSPVEPRLRGPMIPHSLTLILEGQGYILALFAVYLQGKAFFWPQSVGVGSRWKGFLMGLKHTAWVYILVVLLLAAAAIYEPIGVILLAPLFH